MIAFSTTFSFTQLYAIPNQGDVTSAPEDDLCSRWLSGVGTDSTGRSYYHHGGTSNGGSAFLLVYPERQLVVTVAANAFGQLSEREARSVAAFFPRQ